MNQALLFQRVGESNYNRFRRLVLANCGIQDLESKINLPEYGGVPKQCPECAKSLFHSDVNNYFWLKTCPIHLRELTWNCPDCGYSWPRLRDLSKRKCATCGGKMTPNELSKIPPRLNVDQEPLFKIYQAFGRNDHPALKSYKFSVVDRFGVSMPRKELIYTDWYPSFVAAQLELSEDEVSEFESIGVRFRKLNQLHFKWDECAISNQERHSTHEYQLQGKIRNRILSRATKSLNNVIPKKHFYLQVHNSEYCKDKKCPFCQTHKVLSVAALHENVDYFSRNQKIEIKHIYSDFVLPNMAFSLVHFNHYRLPRRVSRLIYYLDLWVFFINLFYFFSTQETSYSARKYEEPTHSLESPSNRYLCPLQIVENSEDGLVLYYPSVIPKQELHVSQDIFKLIKQRPYV